MLLCKSAKVGGRDTFRVSGLGLRVSGAGHRVRVLNLYLMPNTRTRDLTAETWDLRTL
jgi:hypothetical protein